MLKISKQHGVTLLELMIALTVSTIVIGALVALFFTSTKHNRETVEIAKLDNQLNLVLNSMARDIRRAGYWADADTSSTNPFMVTGSTDITVNGSNDCILLTYDHDADGALPSIGAGTDDERYGYRLLDGAVQYRPSGKAFSCTAGAQDWEDLTDKDIVNITALNIVLNNEDVDIDGAESGTALMRVRNVVITISGELVDDTAIQRTLTRQVKIYNDKYIP